MHEVLVNPLGGLSLPRKSVVRLTDRPDLTLDVYPGRKTTMQQQQKLSCRSKFQPLILASLEMPWKSHELRGLCAGLLSYWYDPNESGLGSNTVGGGRILFNFESGVSLHKASNSNSENHAYFKQINYTFLH